jgi:hypothetical protein
VPQAFALVQRRSHQAQLSLRKITQTAMNQLRRSRRSLARKVAAIDERHAQPARRRVTGNRSAVDTAADHRDVERFGAQPFEMFSA